MSSVRDVRAKLREARHHAHAVGVCVNVRLKIPDDADVTITYDAENDYYYGR